MIFNEGICEGPVGTIALSCNIDDLDDFASEIFTYTKFAIVDDEFVFQTLEVDHTKILQKHEGKYAIGFTVIYDANGVTGV